jgi:hypothetical protein
MEEYVTTAARKTSRINRQRTNNKNRPSGVNKARKTTYKLTNKVANDTSQQTKNYSKQTKKSKTLIQKRNYQCRN